MASLLTPHSGREQPAAKVHPSSKAKVEKRSVVPAIPKGLERRTLEKDTRTSISTSGLEDKVEHTTAEDNAPPENISRGLASNSHENCEINGIIGGSNVNESLQSGGAPVDTETSYPSLPRPGNEAENHESSFSMPLQAAENKETSHPTLSLPRQDLLSPPHIPSFHPHGWNQTIIFGNEDSNQSSPTLPPSLASTTLTHPTPVSDTTSSRSQSQYQGYAHAYLPFGPYYSPKWVPSFQPVADISCDVPPKASPEPTVELSQLMLVPSEETTVQYRELSEGDGLEPLHTYLLNQFNDPLYADCELMVHAGEQVVSFMVHRLLVARSPKVKALLQSAQEYDQDGRVVLHLRTRDSSINISAISTALRTCYGETLLQAFRFMCTNASSVPEVDELEDRKERDVEDKFEMALAFLAAGQVLEMPAIAATGSRIALQELTFAHLEKAFSFVLRGTVPRANDSDPSFFSVNGAYPSGAYTQDLLEGLVAFTVTNFPKSFQLDTLAKSLDELGGLPTASAADHGGVVFNPRLRSIRFGDFPLPSSTENSILSSVLLSVPFDILENILDRLTRPDIIQHIVDEREQRRLTYLHARARGGSMPNHESLDSKAMWEEKVIGSNSDLKIKRSWTGPDTTVVNH